MPNDAVISMNRNFTRPVGDIVKQFLVPSGYITDLQGRRGALAHGIKPMFDFPAFVGPAVTVKTKR